MTFNFMSDEERYSNRMLDNAFAAQNKDLKEHIDLVAKPILDQVTKTNGRTTALEAAMIKQANLNTALKVGGAVIFFFLTTVVFPILTWQLLQLVGLREEVQKQVKTSVDEAFNKNLELNP